MHGIWYYGIWYFDILQHGPRPHPDECSGSDLDGDLYFVCWDQQLLPTTIYEAMDYSAPPAICKATGDITADMADFFVEFLKGDALGVISNAHMVSKSRVIDHVYELVP